MSSAILISAALLGLGGSLHCVGMCGPLAISMPMAGLSPSQRAGGIAAYFLGKTATYVLLGLLFGMLGEQLVLAGLQRWLSLVLGIAMLLFAVATIFSPVIFHSNRLTLYLGNKLSPLMGYFLKRPGLISSFVFGNLNGLLPCGLVYVALSAAVATGSLQMAASFMLVFGLATAPLMLSLVLFSNHVGMQYRNKMRRWLPAFTAVVAVLLILRGLDLGIPYISPHIHSITTGPDGTPISCH